MRNWINLLESAVPSFVERVTDDLLDEILSTGKWVHHGCDIEDQWDQGAFEGYIDSSFDQKPFAEVRNTPEFRSALHDLLIAMANEQYKNLTQGSEYQNVPPLGPTSKLYRGISVKGGLKGTTGVYWSQVKDQSVGRFIDEATGGWLFVAEAKDATIDWEATIRSRLDYGNGADEHEIQLQAGTPVKTRIYRVDFKNGRPTLTDRGYFNYRA